MRFTKKELDQISNPAIKAQILKALGSSVNVKRKVSIPVESSLEIEFQRLLSIYKIPQPVKQYRFCNDRKWAIDFAWVDKKCGVEVDGERHHARWHQTTKDALKRNTAQQMGWQIIVATGTMLKQDPDSFMQQLKKILE